MIVQARCSAFSPSGATRGGDGAEPRAISYVRADKAFNLEPDSYSREEPVRGTVCSNQEIGKGRTDSMCFIKGCDDRNDNSTTSRLQ